MGEIQTQKESLLIFQMGSLSGLSCSVQNCEQQLCVVVAPRELTEHQERRKDSKKEEGMENTDRRDEDLYF